MSTSTLGATEHRNEPAANRVHPDRKTGLRPKRSLIGPARTVASVEKSRNENTVLFRYNAVTPNASAIDGSAGAYMSIASIWMSSTLITQMKNARGPKRLCSTASFNTPSSWNDSSTTCSGMRQLRPKAGCHAAGPSSPSNQAYRCRRSRCERLARFSCRQPGRVS